MDAAEPDAGQRDPRWVALMRAVGLGSGVLALLGSLDQVEGSAGLGVVLVAAALWTVELLATPSRWAVEWTLVVGVGLCGAYLNASAPESSGFLFAYFAAAAAGVRFTTRPAVSAAFVVLGTVAVGIVARGDGHAVASLSADVLGIAFAASVAHAFRNARLAKQRADALLVELERSRAAEAEARVLAERTHLAREIHDILAHSLTGQVLSLEAARILADRTGADPRLREQLDRAHRLARSGLVETRQAVAALRDGTPPGVAAVPGLVEAFARDHGVEATFAQHGVPVPLAAEAEVAVHRTVQEGLTNVAKHAPPGRSVQVTLTWSAERVLLTVRDQGERAAAGAAASRTGLVPPGGHGLTGLRERAELAGGTLLCDATPESFEVRLELPTLAAGKES